MDEQDPIRQLGRWIAHRATGTARLSWSGGEVSLGIRGGRIVTLVGLDPEDTAGRLGCATTRGQDLLAEARAIASRHGVAEAQVVIQVKEALQTSLRAWYLDPRRRLGLEDQPVEAPADGPTISVTHALVEMLLNDADQRLASTILPDLDVVLGRATTFLELYSPLRLSEDADLIVAKVTGHRTAAEIAARSPHGTDEVRRLLAALVATGMLETGPPPASAEELVLLPATLVEESKPSHRLGAGWLLLAGAVLVTLLAIAVVVLRARAATPTPVTTEWGVVVDMGCEPDDLQRVLRKANQQSQILTAVKASDKPDEPCWRLVWGHFRSLQDATTAAANVPSNLRRQGFNPHPIEIDARAGHSPPATGQE